MSKTTNYPLLWRTLLLSLTLFLMRQTLVAQTVTQATDAGPGSLRETITNAAPGSTIQFVPGLDTIRLSREIILDKDLNINGEGASVVISGENLTRIFKITAGNIHIKSLSCIHGFAKGGNGGNSSNPGGGGAGMGGAIFIIDGNLHLEGLRFLQNLAIGGNGGAVAPNSNTIFGGGGGGGIDGLDGQSGLLGGFGGNGGGILNGTGASSFASPHGESGGFGTGGGGGFAGTDQGGTFGNGGNGGFGGGGAGAGSLEDFIFFNGRGGTGGYGGGGGAGYNQENPRGSEFFGASGGMFGGNGGFRRNGGGGAGLGGAIFIKAGTLALTSVYFEGNTAQGGQGFRPGQGKGAALFVHPDADVRYQFLRFSGNTSANARNNLPIRNNLVNDNQHVYGNVQEIITPISPEQAIVTSKDDFSPGSLRNIVQSVPSGTRISFALQPGDTIQLDEEIFIDKDLIFAGDTQPIYLSGQHKTRLFFIDSGNVTFRNIHLLEGNATGGTGGPGGGGAAGMGGAIFIRNGNVTLDSVVLKQNQAIGGNGGQTTQCGGGGGGGFGNDPGQAGNSFSQLTFGCDGGNGGGLFGGQGGIGSESGGTAGSDGGFGSGGGGGGGGRVGSSPGGNGGFGGGGGSSGMDADFFSPSKKGGDGGFGGGGGVGGTPGQGGKFGGTPTRRVYDWGEFYEDGAGGAGLGGALFIKAGTLTLNTVTFMDNVARGGKSPLDNDISHGKGKGGALFVMEEATVTAQTLTFFGNQATDNANDTPTQNVAFNDNNAVYGFINANQAAIQIDKLFLWDASADTIIAEITEGAVIKVPNNAQQKLSIQVTTIPELVNAVSLDLTGASTAQRKEFFPPYTLFGDRENGKNLQGQSLATGHYQITAIAFGDPEAPNALSLPLTRNFSLESDFEVFLMDANTDQPIAELVDGKTYDFADLRTRSLSILINSKQEPGSIQFALKGPVPKTRVENIPPFALFGDGDAGNDLFGDVFSSGDYTLTLTQYAEDKAQGEASSPIVIRFRLQDLQVQKVWLVDAQTDERLMEITNIRDSTDIVVSDLAQSPLGFVSEYLPGAQSVEFTVFGPSERFRLTRLQEGQENYAPYSAYGDAAAGQDIFGATFLEGFHVLLTTAFSEKDLKGTRGPTKRIAFTLVNQQNITVYPNASEGLFHIQRKQASPVQWILRDQFGQIKATGVQKSTVFDLDLRNFRSGIYLLDFVEGTQHKTKKIIIRR